MNTLDDWLAEWQLVLDSSGKVVDKTVTVYLRTGRQFLAWLRTTHPDVVEPAAITPRVCREWMAHLTAAGKAEATRRRDGIAVRKFLGYIAAESDSGLEANPAAVLDLPMAPVKPVMVLDDETLGVLLRSMAGNDFMDRRDTAIVRLLLDTGLRREELVTIDVDDLDLRRQEVTVTGKGSKTRTVPFSNRTALGLRKYLRVREQRPAAGHPALFLSLRPSARGEWRLTGGGVGEMFTRRAEAAGLAHLYPHMMRHTWAADLKAAGVHDDHLERLAGWSTPTMSRRYGNAVADQQARAAARKLARGDRV